MSRSPFRRKNRKGWAVKYDGGRRQKHFKLKAAADAFAAIEEHRKLAGLGVPSQLSFEAYAKTWLRRVAAASKRRTAEQYGWALERYLIPAFGRQAVSALSRGDTKDFLADLRTQPGRRGKKLSRRSVAHLWGILRTCLESAKDDGLIQANPAEKMGRKLKLLPSRAEKGAKTKALDADQLRRFLAAAGEALRRRDALLFRTMASTGMRPGEAAALAWEDLDLKASTALVRRTADQAQESGASDETKTGAERTVDLPAGLVLALKAWSTEAKTAALSGGKRPRWIFATEEGAPADLSAMRKRFTRALERAGLPSGFSPHSLRHTYASLMLAAGEPLVYVQEQLGHADIRLTVHLYGRWLRKRAPGAVDRLEELVSKGRA